MDAPPSRYRVVERGGRLVVIDTQSGTTPLKAKDLLPDVISDRDPAAADPEPARDLILDMPAPPTPSYAASRSPVAQPPGLLRAVAATVCSDRRDGDGRLQWTTARWFDARGPRTVTLVRKSEEQLGFATVALLALAFGAVIFVVAFGFVAIIILFVAGSFARQAKPLATAWIDRLALR